MNNERKPMPINLQRLSMVGVLVAFGIVFGDIGTSPLYVMKTIMHANPSYDANYIVGAVSCIIWTLTLQTTVKYVLIALHADNHGEGGILALYALVRKHRRKWLYIVAAIGAATLIADGVITPSITVTSAIEGLQDINPETPVVPITIAIITGIFFVQQFGTSTIGKFFGPFMLCWFVMLGVMGAMHIAQYPFIVKAFNPYYAIRTLVLYPNWFLVMGAVFLCTTGAEALYSDLGHCGRKNITASWLFVKTMLIVNYMGQGAWIIAGIGHIPEGMNPFYGIMPRSFLPFGVALATGAAIIASQALISGCFTILSEAMHLDFWPNLRIKYPTNVKGQLYIPLVNTALYVFCITTVLLFQTSAHMEAAYGLAITITMIATTVLLAFYLRMKNGSRMLVGAFFLVYLSIESVFFFANVTKFAHGGWFTLLLAGLFFAIMYVWHDALKIRRNHFGYKRLADYYSIISDIKHDVTIPKYASNLVYVNSAGREGMVDDKIVYSIINKSPKRADHYWLLHFERLDEPDTLEYSVTPLVTNTLFQVNIRIGFRIQPQMSLYLRQVIEDMVAEGRFDLTSQYPSLRKRNIPGDFRFIVIHRIYYPMSSESNHDNTIMNMYGIVKRMGISDERALGLDTSNVVVENVPLIIANRRALRIRKAVEEEQQEEMAAG